MLKPYPANGNMLVDFVQADQFYPVAFDANGRIIACVFSDTRTIGQSYYTRLEYHRFDGNAYLITNMAYKSDTPNVLGRAIDLGAVPDWAGLEQEATVTGIDKPLFAYFRYPRANNIDTTSPLGVSCFSRATELIEQADKQWSNLLWEFESGKRAIYVEPEAFDKGADGKPKLPDKRLYRVLDSVSDVGAGGKLFSEWSPAFREASIISGLDAILKKIEFSCGLAYGTLSDPNTVDKTATEIVSSKQRSAATVVDCQKALESALSDLLYAMDAYATMYALSPGGSFELACEFDDSIVTDHVTQFAQDTQALGLQVMSKVKFLMRNYGMTEEMAKEEIAQIQAESAANMDMFGLPVNGQNQPGEGGQNNQVTPVQSGQQIAQQVV